MAVGFDVGAALFTLLYIGKLLFEGEGGSSGRKFEKRSLLNQRVRRNVQIGGNAAS